MPTPKLTAQEIEELQDMPPRCHYPNRQEKFDFSRSEVIQFIQDQFGVALGRAISMFEAARHGKHIVYDPTQKEWMGRKRMQPANGNE